MFKLRLRLKFQETLFIKFTATKKPGKKKTVIFILNNPPKTRNSPPKKLIKSSGYNEEICTELIKPHVFFSLFPPKNLIKKQVFVNKATDVNSESLNDKPLIKTSF